MCVMTTYVLCTRAQRSHPPARPKALGTRPRPGCLSPGRRGPNAGPASAEPTAAFSGPGGGEKAWESVCQFQGGERRAVAGRPGPEPAVAALRLRVPRVPPCATAAAAASSSPLLSRPLRPARATSSAGHRAGKSVATALGAGQRLCCGARPARTARRSSAFCMPGTGDADRSPGPRLPQLLQGGWDETHWGLAEDRGREGRAWSDSRQPGRPGPREPRGRGRHVGRRAAATSLTRWGGAGRGPSVFCSGAGGGWWVWRVHRAGEGERSLSARPGACGTGGLRGPGRRRTVEGAGPARPSTAQSRLQTPRAPQGRAEGRRLGPLRQAVRGTLQWGRRQQGTGRVPGRHSREAGETHLGRAGARGCRAHGR